MKKKQNRRVYMIKIMKSNITEYATYLAEQEKSVATIEKYIRDITAFAEWLGDKPADKLTVLKYKDSLVEKLAPASVNSVISSLNGFFVYNGWYTLKIRVLKIQKQIFARSDKELTKDEYQRLVDAAKRKGNEKLSLLMQTICSTGIRVSELKYITVESIRREQSDISLKGKMRVVIIPKSLCRMLLSYAKRQKITSGPIFVTKKGTPLDRSNIWKLMKALCESANVPKNKVFPHNLRHLFARTFYSIRKDIVRLADILGHTSVNTTRIYTMETGEIHRRQIQNLGLLRC